MTAIIITCLIVVGILYTHSYMYEEKIEYPNYIIIMSICLCLIPFVNILFTAALVINALDTITFGSDNGLNFRFSKEERQIVDEIFKFLNSFIYGKSK